MPAHHRIDSDSPEHSDDGDTDRGHTGREDTASITTKTNPAGHEISQVVGMSLAPSDVAAFIADADVFESMESQRPATMKGDDDATCGQQLSTPTKPGDLQDRNDAEKLVECVRVIESTRKDLGFRHAQSRSR